MSLRSKINLLFTLLLSVYCVLYISSDAFSWPFISICIGIIILINFTYAKTIREFRIKDHQQEQLIKMTQREAELKTNQLALLIERLPYPLCFINQQGTITIKNENFNQLTHVNTLNIDINHPELSVEVRQILREAFMSEKLMSTRKLFDNKTFQVDSLPINQNHRYYGALVIIQDVSRLLEGERIQKRFIADASHELKTPIAAIKGMCEILLREDFDDPEALHDFLIQINKENTRLELLVSDLISVSRLASNKVQLDKTRFNLYDVISSCIHSVRNKISLTDNRVLIHGDPNFTMFGDQLKWSQIIQNLLDNALQYTSNGQVTISYEIIQNELVINVSDTGSGIAEEDVPHVFERFYRGSQSRNRQTGGSGLGLAIVKSLVEAHHGTIMVQSKRQEGTHFTIKLTEY